MDKEGRHLVGKKIHDEHNNHTLLSSFEARYCNGCLQSTVNAPDLSEVLFCTDGCLLRCELTAAVYKDAANPVPYCTVPLML